MPTTMTWLRLILLIPLVCGLATVDRTQTSETIPGQYIVRLESNALIDTIAETIQKFTGVLHIEKHIIGDFKALSVHASDNVLDAIAAVPFVKTIRPNVKIYPHGTIDKRTYVQQVNAPWHLARISFRNRGATNYVFDDTAGRNMTIYVLDTGINTAHVEFQGRARFGTSTCDSSVTTADTDGHGTYCAGLAVGSGYGGAKGAFAVGVKVFCPSAGTTQILRAVQWTLNDARTNNRLKTSVMSMSFGANTVVKEIDDAVDNAAIAGIIPVAAAGNSGSTTLASPATSKYTCVIGASDEYDRVLPYSNYGSRVQLYAPGSNVIGPAYDSQTGTMTASGTSASAPIVAGLAAYLIKFEGYQNATVLCSRMQTLATKGRLTPATKAVNNNIAFNGYPSG